MHLPNGLGSACLSPLFGGDGQADSTIPLSPFCAASLSGHPLTRSDDMAWQSISCIGTEPHAPALFCAQAIHPLAIQYLIHQS